MRPPLNSWNKKTKLNWLLTTKKSYAGQAQNRIFILFIKGIGEAWLFRWDCWLIDILSGIFIYFESVCDCLTFKSEEPTLADLQKYVYWGEL